MKKGWIIIGAIIVLVMGIWGYTSIKDGINGQEVFKVKREDLQEIISEVGKVVPVTDIEMTFPMTGKIAQVYVDEGQEVSKGDTLVKLDTSKIEANLANAQASVQEAQARLDKAYAGYSVEEIRIAETAVSNAQVNLDKVRLASNSEIDLVETNIASAETALANAEKTYSDQEKKNEEDLKQAYEDAIDILRDSNTKADTALNTYDLVQENRFNSNSTLDTKIKDQEEDLIRDFDDIQILIDDAVITNYEGVDTALNEMSSFLNDFAEALAFMRESMERPGEGATLTEKGYIDTERTNIDYAITNTNTAIQTISSAKLSNEININSAQSSLDSAQATLSEAESSLSSTRAQWNSRISEAEGALRLAQDELSLKRAGSTTQDIALYRAQVNQAIAYVDVIQQDLYDAELYAPSDGVVTNIYTEVGELASVNRPVLSVIAKEEYQIESYISELDIAHVKISDPAEITFDAFGKFKIFNGSVIEINPYETIIDGDIYYKTTIQIDEYDENIRSGMTADIEIMTAEKEDVLVVPGRYIGDEGGREYVKLILEGIQPKEEEEYAYKMVEIETGLEGEDMTEVLSGLEEGQKIIPYY